MEKILPHKSPRQTPQYKNPLSKNTSYQQKITKQNVFFLWLISFITLGIYVPIWYLKRKSEFDGLNIQKKINKSMIISYLILIIIYAIYRIINFAFNGVLRDFLGGGGIVTIAILVIMAITFIFLHFVLVFNVRTILNEVWTSKKINRKVSWFFTLIFGIFYLQYEINRTIENRENMKRIGPWVFLILLPLITLIFVVISVLWVFISLQVNLESGTSAIEQLSSNLSNS